MIRKNAKSSTVTKLKGGSSLDIPPQLSPEELIPTINDRLRRINQAAADTRAIAQNPASLEVQNNGALPSSTQSALNLIPGANVTISSVANPDKKRTDVTIASQTALEVDKAGVLVGTRGKLNLIEGANVTLTVADNPGSSRVDVTVAAAGGGGGGFPWITLTDPSGVSFAWRNQGAATEDVINQSRYLLSPALGGDNIRGREIAAPVSPWTITAGFVPQIHSVNFNGMGLYVSDGTKLVTMDLTYAAMHINYLTNVTTWSSSPTSVAFAFSPPVLFYRVTVSGGTMTWYWSVDKVHWMQFYTTATTAWLASASYVGFFANSNNGTWPAATLLVDWTQT